nr:hypothetical protein [uncultured bacterium]
MPTKEGEANLNRQPYSTFPHRVNFPRWDVTRRVVCRNYLG